MKHFFQILITGILLAATSYSGHGQSRAVIDFEAADAISVPSGDSTVLALVGNVMLHHNGAILSCDSAVRYNANYFECFDNVIINRDSAYIYGDRADLNGIDNLAQVYAPIVKTVNGDMTMYSYDMTFNTLTKIGRFTKGGTITQKDNLMEAVEGIYHAEEREVFFVKNVVMRNEEYIIQTDSMGYNFDTEVSTFYKPAKIWNKDGDFLSADKGSYDRINDTYIFTENSYILTKEQEVFADSITYMNTAGMAYAFNNVQIHDEEQSAFLLGDFGIYWMEDQQGIMTDNPSVIGYDKGAEKPDSVFMRGDTIFMHTFESDIEFTPEVAARLRLPGRGQVDSMLLQIQEELMIMRPDSILPDSLSNWSQLYGEEADSTRLQYGMRGEEWTDSDRIQQDSVFSHLRDSLLNSGISPDSLSFYLPDPGITDEITPDSLTQPFPDLTGLSDVTELSDSLAIGIPPDSTAYNIPIFSDNNRPGGEYPLIVDPPTDTDTDSEAEQENDAAMKQGDDNDKMSQTPVSETGAEKIPENQKLEKPKTKKELRQEKRLEKRKNKMVEYAIEQGLIDSLPPVDSVVVDSLPPVLEEVIVDTLPKDSLQRAIRLFNNVRIFRDDVQAVCDSLIGFSIDSTAHMYINPILWSQDSQIISEEMHFYTKNEQLYRADFEGDPIMSQWVIDSLYNQVVGDLIEAYFKNNEIVRAEVLQNSKTYYYMQDEDDPNHIGGFFDIKSKDITIMFDSMKVVRISYKTRPEYIFYPMDKIPADHTQRFDRFEWREDRRPKTRYEVCDRYIRISRREETESIPYPLFRITNKMDADKKRYTQDGIWRDRNDLLSVDPSYFMNKYYD